MKAETINVNDCIQSDVILFKITGIRKFNFRLNTAIILFRLGAWIMPIKTKVEFDAPASTSEGINTAS